MTERDWKEIEREFRAGQISIRQLCSLHRVSRADLMEKADKDGWTRDLTGTVRAAVADRLMHADGAEADPDDVVDRAAQRAVAIVLSHRKDIAKLRGTVDGMADALQRIAKGQATDDDMALMGKGSAADLLDKLSAAMTKLVALERASHNIDALVNTNTGVALPGSDPAAGGPSVTFYLPNNNRDA